MWPLSRVSTLWSVSVWVGRAGVVAVVLSGATTSWLRRMSKELSLRSADYLDLLSQWACPAELIPMLIFELDNCKWTLEHQILTRYILTLIADSGPAGSRPVPANRGYPGWPDRPGYRKREADRQRSVLLQGRHRWGLQWQEGDHEPESGQRWVTLWNNFNVKCILVSVKAGFLNKTVRRQNDCLSMCQSRCTFVADSSNHHFHSNNYPQQSHRAVDLHRWETLLEQSNVVDSRRTTAASASTRFQAWPSYSETCFSVGDQAADQNLVFLLVHPIRCFALFVVVVNWRSLLSSHLDLLKNSTLLRSDIISVSHDNPPSVMNTDPQDSILTSLSVHDR